MPWTEIANAILLAALMVGVIGQDCTFAGPSYPFLYPGTTGLCCSSDNYDISRGANSLPICIASVETLAVGIHVNATVYAGTNLEVINATIWGNLYVIDRLNPTSPSTLQVHMSDNPAVVVKGCLILDKYHSFLRLENYTGVVYSNPIYTNCIDGTFSDVKFVQPSAEGPPGTPQPPPYGTPVICPSGVVVILPQTCPPPAPSPTPIPRPSPPPSLMSIPSPNPSPFPTFSAAFSPTSANLSPIPTPIPITMPSHSSIPSPTPSPFSSSDIQSPSSSNLSPSLGGERTNSPSLAPISGSPSFAPSLPSTTYELPSPAPAFIFNSPTLGPSDPSSEISPSDSNSISPPGSDTSSPSTTSSSEETVWSPSTLSPSVYFESNSPSSVQGVEAPSPEIASPSPSTRPFAPPSSIPSRSLTPESQLTSKSDTIPLISYTLFLILLAFGVET